MVRVDHRPQAAAGDCGILDVGDRSDAHFVGVPNPLAMKRRQERAFVVAVETAHIVEAQDLVAGWVAEDETEYQNACSGRSDAAEEPATKSIIPREVGDNGH